MTHEYTSMEVILIFCTNGKIRVNFISKTYEILSLGFMTIFIVPGMHCFCEGHIKVTQNMVGYNGIPAAIAHMGISCYGGHY